MMLKPPVKMDVPYGGRLVWTLPGDNRLFVHLKDKFKIRTKKRWSQVSTGQNCGTFLPGLAQVVFIYRLCTCITYWGTE